MARTGPAPKPAELRALEGNRGHRAVDITGMFRPEVGLPPMPKDLSPGARKVWKRLSPELLRYNLLSTVYSDAFEDLCETISDVKMLRHALRGRQALLRADGKPEADAWCVNTPNGMPVQHPLVLNLRNTRADMHRLIAQFGLTPAESARVTTAVRAQLQLFDNTGAVAAARPAGSTPGGFSEF